jgi:hypothetical protein
MRTHGATLACLLLVTTIPLTGLATERETISTITKLYSYTQLGGGDIIVAVADPPTGCPQGFWLSPDDDGFKTTYGVLLSAFHTEATVRISGEDTLLWSGSAGAFCRMTFAGLD